MLIAPEVHDWEFAPLLEGLLQITGAQPWMRRREWIRRQLQRNPLLEEYLNEHHSLEIQFEKARSHWVKTGRVQTTLEGEEAYKLYAFITQYMRVYERLSSAAKTRFRGMLLDGLKDPSKKGLLSLQQELTTSAHLMSLGFDVEFSDLEGTGRCDFFLRRDGVELDAECKMVSCDIGRKIPRLIAAEVLYGIQKEVQQHAAHLTGGRCLHVRVPDRLEAEQGRRDAIVKAAGRTLRTGISDEVDGVCRTSLLDFSLSSSPFNVSNPNQVSLEGIRKLSESLVGNDNPQLAVFFKPGKMAVVTIIQSDKKDRVLEAIFDVLGEAASSQLTGTRPGALFAQLHDLTADAIVSLGERDTVNPAIATGIQILAHHFLSSATRQHVHVLGFRSHGRISRNPEPDETGATSVTSEGGEALVYYNPNSPVAGDDSFRVFTQVPRVSPILLP